MKPKTVIKVYFIVTRLNPFSLGEYIFLFMTDAEWHTSSLLNAQRTSFPAGALCGSARTKRRHKDSPLMHHSMRGAHGAQKDSAALSKDIPSSRSELFY